MSAGSEQWPELRLDAWRDTYDTLHRWAQIVGKTRLALTPVVNHWWNVPFYLTSRGLTTSAMHAGGIGIEIEFDFVEHVLRITTDGKVLRIPLQPMSVADFYRKYMAALRSIGVEVHVRPIPTEMGDTLTFTDDTVHASYDPDYANRFWRILLESERVFYKFRARYLGKTSPTHFFWGGFDLAQTRFSGRSAPPHPGGIPNAPDWVMREGYSHELASAGFWPGSHDKSFGPQDASYYAYAYPEPPGYSAATVEPEQAHYDSAMHEFFLPYEAMRTAKFPDRALLDFLQSAYEAAADLGNWDRPTLERWPPESDTDEHADVEIRHNSDQHRFEAPGGAFLEYRLRDNRFYLTHTEVPPQFAGKGIGTALVKYALDFARREKLQVYPSCPFVAAYIKRHPEYADLVA